MHVHFALVPCGHVTIKTHPPAAPRATAAVVGVMLPSGMYHMDNTAQHSTTQRTQASRRHIITLRNIIYRYVHVNCCVRIFLLSSLIVLSPSSFFLFFRKLRLCCRPELDTASKHRAISSAQVALGIVKSLVAPNHGPLLSASFIFCSLLDCASAADGCRPRSGALLNTCAFIQGFSAGCDWLGISEMPQVKSERRKEKRRNTQGAQAFL